MGYGAVLRERVPAIKFLVNAQKTVWYPILFAVLCIISGSSSHEVYLPIIFILCSFVIFSALFTDDNKVFLTPMLMIYYSLGMDNPKANPGGMENDSLLSSFDFDSFKVIIICGIMVVAIFVTRLIADGSIARIFKQRRIGAIGILALDVALLTNGLFNPNYTPMTLLYGAIMAISLTFFYFLCAGMLSKSKSEDIIPYACKAMVCTAYVALCQFLIKAVWAYSEGILFNVAPGTDVLRINRSVLSLAWGLPTMISAVFVLGIPAAFYLARNHKYGILSCLSAVAFLVGTFMINTRSAMLVGVVAFMVCAFMCCLKNEKHPANALCCRIMSALFLVGIGYLVVKIISVEGGIHTIMDMLRLEDYSDNTRIQMWKTGLDHFLANPIFGSGFDTGSNITNNVFSSMYHCIIVQALGSMGIFGAAALLTHFTTFAVIFFKKFSLNKFLLLLIPLMLLGMSLVDNFFFYPNSQIFYCVFIVLAEIITQGDRESPQEDVSCTAN